jgi:DNA-binding NarL/FixJ family response regulator
VSVSKGTQNGGARRLLSPRQLEVLTLVARGLSTDGIAAELVISPTTVRAHVRNILDTLGARNRAHAVAIACSTGLIRLDDDAARQHLPLAPPGVSGNGRPDALA